MTNLKAFLHLTICLLYLLDCITLTARQGWFNCPHNLPQWCAFVQVDVSFGNLFNFPVWFDILWYQFMALCLTDFTTSLLLNKSNFMFYTWDLNNVFITTGMNGLSEISDEFLSIFWCFDKWHYFQREMRKIIYRKSNAYSSNFFFHFLSFLSCRYFHSKFMVV